MVCYPVRKLRLREQSDFPKDTKSIDGSLKTQPKPSVMSPPDKQGDWDARHCERIHSPHWAAGGFVGNEIYRASEGALLRGPVSSKLIPGYVANHGS